jgi:thiol-disulfide isomerase/thioredoxin
LIVRFLITVLALLFSMTAISAKRKLKEGVYKGVLLLDSLGKTELPFIFEVNYSGKKPELVIRNAEERIHVNNISIKGDSVNFFMPVFDTEFRCVMKGDDLEGKWINHYRAKQNELKFYARFGESNRFPYVPGKSNPFFEGKWETTFSPGKSDSTKAIAIFRHQEQTDYVYATFLTETGDYRYLEGMRHGNKLSLSTFDGSHAYLFEAEMKGENIEGTFYSGTHWKENWVARKNEKFRLRDAEEITGIVQEKISFRFNSLDGKQVSLSDEKFNGKVVIVQLMGSWCPNCMDESRYLNELYRLYKVQGLEVVALAFEKTNDPEISRRQVSKMKQQLGLEYEILLTCKSGKKEASGSIEGIKEIFAFPTTIFLDRQHKVLKTHTGFSGPATGEEYLKFKTRTENLIKSILKE